MRIGGTSGDKTRDAAIISNTKKDEEAKAKETQSSLGSKAVGDKVSVKSAIAINEELDPQKIAAERKAKVEEIKAKIAHGEYQIPASELLAEKTSSGIDEEVDFLRELAGEDSSENTDR